ncbi:iron-containing alcohol dehydrogenase family protein [Halanaerobium kushneri]|uniref:Alcohol dehydrogenase n=1 Tax=Halanaerobium kushneri TaxID=56779 RepID=A0A1N6QSB0_9FIRM|nr:iron-containing alcohol dehydrogenase [Halanaerobium kushneri]SIQ19428.1 alcohol dehydrogenase [Halanaerobium kushneri]
MQNQSELNQIKEMVYDQVMEEAGLGYFYKFIMPEEVLVGPGCVRKIGKEAVELGNKALLVTDKGITNLNLHSSTVRSLEKNGVQIHIYDQVQSDPDDKVIMEGVRTARDKNVDFIVAIGGGSSLDAAKAISFMLNNPEPISQYEGADKIENPGLPLIAIATTAGTGSEVSVSTVVTDSKRNKKMVISSKYLVPKIAVVDAELTSGLPASITAATGIDVLVHAVEAYLSKNSITISRALADHSVKYVVENLPLAVGNGENIEARHRMCIASLMAGMAFSNVGLGVCHATAHQLGTTYNIPHGVANAIMLPAVLKFNKLVSKKQLSELAHSLGAKIEGLTEREAAEAAIKEIKYLISDLGLPSSISEIGGSKDDFKSMARDALDDPTLATNPRKADLSDILKIYENAF